MHHHPSAANWTARLRLSKLLFNQRRGITCRWSHGGDPWQGWDNWGWFYLLFVWFTSITSNGWALLAACATTPLLQTGRPGWAFQSFSSTKGAASPAGEAMEWRCWDNWGWFYNVFVWGRSWGLRLRYCLPLEVWFPSFRWNVVYAGTTPIWNFPKSWHTLYMRADIYLQTRCETKILGMRGYERIYAFRCVVSKLSVECGFRRNHRTFSQRPPSLKLLGQGYRRGWSSTFHSHTNLKLSKVLT